MTNQRPDRFRTGLLLVILLSFSVIIAGCSDDDDNGSPTAPSDTEFDEFMAISQAEFAAPLAVSMLENVVSLTQGLTGKDFDYSFEYDSDTQSWVASTTYEMEGYSYQYTYTVQYRDAMGQPQPSEVDAASMRYAEDGAIAYDFSGDGYSLIMNYDFGSDVTASGLQTGTLLIDGGGGYEMDYDVTSDGQREVFAYTFGWETLGAGVSFPIDGCPTGSMRYHFSPYTLDLVFDGSSTVAFSMRDGNGNLVPGGSGTETIFCND